MTVRHAPASPGRGENLSVEPLLAMETGAIPRHELPSGEMPPDIAYQIIHDELMLDGNARMNLATFVTPWMEPQAEQLMCECF
jgi:glutamate decarboxylase